MLWQRRLLVTWAAYLGRCLPGDESSNPWRVSPFTWFQQSPCGGRELPFLSQVCICPWNNPYGQGLVFLRWTKPESCRLPYSRERGQLQIHLLERVPHKVVCYWRKLGGRKSGRIKTIITTAHPCNLPEWGGKQPQVSKSWAFFTSNHPLMPFKCGQEGAPRRPLGDSFKHVHPGDSSHDVVEVHYLYYSDLESIKPV